MADNSIVYVSLPEGSEPYSPTDNHFWDTPKGCAVPNGTALTLDFLRGHHVSWSSDAWFGVIYRNPRVHSHQSNSFPVPIIFVLETNLGLNQASGSKGDSRTTIQAITRFALVVQYFMLAPNISALFRDQSMGIMSVPLPESSEPSDSWGVLDEGIDTSPSGWPNPSIPLRCPWDGWFKAQWIVAEGYPHMMTCRWWTIHIIDLVDTHVCLGYLQPYTNYSSIQLPQFCGGNFQYLHLVQGFRTRISSD